jgi:acyl-CoA dehydrogenase
MTLPLSIDDLGLFFAPHHAALATKLRAAAGPLAALGHDARALVRALGETGVADVVVAEPFDVRGLCLAREMTGWASPTADGILAVQGLSHDALRRTGHPEAARIVAGVRRGDAIGAFALTEPGAGSDVAAVATRATRDGDHVRLDGTKTFISNAGIATHYTVFATLDPAAGRKGLTAYLVPADAPGLTVEPQPIGDHPIGTVRFAGVRIPASARIGGDGEGFALAMQSLDRFRVSVGAAAVGMARRALHEARVHVMTRVQFGQKLAEQPLVQATLADLATELDAARLLVLRAAAALDAGARATTEVSMAKYYATEAAQRIVDGAVQLFGGLGCVEGNVAHDLYRAIRPLRIYEGTSEIQRLIIGRALTREA